MPLTLSTYLASVDSALGTMTVPNRPAFLQRCIRQIEQRSTEYHPGETAFQITEVLTGLHQRLQDAIAERDLAALPSPSAVDAAAAATSDRRAA